MAYGELRGVGWKVNTGAVGGNALLLRQLMCRLDGVTKGQLSFLTSLATLIRLVSYNQ